MGTVMRGRDEMLDLLASGKRIWSYRQTLQLGQSTALSSRLAILFAALSAYFPQTLQQLDPSARTRSASGGHYG